VLRALDKPALTTWLIEQSVLAAVTTPRNPGEELDAFIQRVLHTEKVQDQESEKARDLGTRIHDELSRVVIGQSCEDDMRVYCEPVYDYVKTLGTVIATEKIIVGAGYAGKTDLAVRREGLVTILDFKSTKKLPKESYREHRLQLAAYAAAFGQTGADRIQTGNIYISTPEPGKTCLCLHDDWQETFEQGFKPLLKLWNWINDYNPQPKTK
jgi:ATP-dependent exoDNAse (exonuclease V) beta subunit